MQHFKSHRRFDCVRWLFLFAFLAIACHNQAALAATKVVTDADKGGEYPPECLYEQLKRRHLRRTESPMCAAAGGGGEWRGGTP